VLYLIMWVVVPLEGTASAGEGAAYAGSIDGTANRQVVVFVGGALLLLGMLFLMQNLFGWWLPWLSFGTLWPLLLIIAGVALVFRQTANKGGLR
jgi:hypothetical protein